MIERPGWLRRLVRYLSVADAPAVEAAAESAPRSRTTVARAAASDLRIDLRVKRAAAVLNLGWFGLVGCGLMLAGHPGPAGWVFAAPAAGLFARAGWIGLGLATPLRGEEAAVARRARQGYRALLAALPFTALYLLAR